MVHKMGFQFNLLFDKKLFECLDFLGWFHLRKQDWSCQDNRNFRQQSWSNFQVLMELPTIFLLAFTLWTSIHLSASKPLLFQLYDLHENETRKLVSNSKEIPSSSHHWNDLLPTQRLPLRSQIILLYHQCLYELMKHSYKVLASLK